MYVIIALISHVACMLSLSENYRDHTSVLDYTVNEFPLAAQKVNNLKKFK
jgi:hypothetical protein